MHDLALKNPDQIKSELDSISEEMSEALYNYRRCEEFKKITFSQITLTKKLENDGKNETSSSEPKRQTS
jgi:hypothetical protein